MRNIILTAILAIITNVTFSQDLAKLFETDEFVWCGLDFSNVRCIGSHGFTDPKAIKNKYFDAWNDLMLHEADKYNFKEAYQKTKQINDLGVVNQRNGMPELGEFVTDNPYKFEKGQLTNIISDYDIDVADEGLGLVYVVESLNKNEQEAMVYTVFFDIATKDLIWVKKFAGSAGGFGFRNYWARSFYEVIKDSKKVYKRAMKDYYKSVKK